MTTRVAEAWDALWFTGTPPERMVEMVREQV